MHWDCAVGSQDVPFDPLIELRYCSCTCAIMQILGFTFSILYTVVTSCQPDPRLSGNVWVQRHLFDISECGEPAKTEQSKN